MKSLIISCCIATLLGGVFGGPVEAKQYRCNGRVQYRPCVGDESDVPESAPSLPDKAAVKPTHGVARPRSSAGQLYAKIVSQQFKQRTPYEGVWTGIVEGNGDVHLELHLKRNGRLETTWYMGHVRLVNKATPFKFVALPPKGTNWSWNIVATAS